MWRLLIFLFVFTVVCIRRKQFLAQGLQIVHHFYTHTHKKCDIDQLYIYTVRPRNQQRRLRYKMLLLRAIISGVHVRSGRLYIFIFSRSFNVPNIIIDLRYVMTRRV